MLKIRNILVFSFTIIALLFIINNNTFACSGSCSCDGAHTWNETCACADGSFSSTSCSETSCTTGDDCCPTSSVSCSECYCWDGGGGGSEFPEPHPKHLLDCEDLGCTCRWGNCSGTETIQSDGICTFGNGSTNPFYMCCCDPGEGLTPTPTPTPIPTPTPTPLPSTINYNFTVNFGIRNASESNVWIQTTGADIRIEGWGEGIGGYNYNVPDPQTTACGGQSTYASSVGSGGSPGIIFTGNSSFSFCADSICQERSSVNQWVVGGTTYPENFGSDGTGGNLKTSYDYMVSRLKEAGITPTETTELSDGLANGAYIISGDLNTPASGYTFASDKDYVFLITGNLNINGNVKVPVGSTATFVVRGDINVLPDVGVISCTSSVSNIEGLYSVDGNFIMQGLNDCDAGVDRRLNLAGNLVINAGLSGGTFQNSRTLCADNATCPVLSIMERPDFILNAPEILKFTNYIWQEQAQ
jgi:hypothetical protein